MMPNESSIRALFERWMRGEINFSEVKELAVEPPLGTPDHQVWQAIQFAQVHQGVIHFPEPPPKRRRKTNPVKKPKKRKLTPPTRPLPTTELGTVFLRSGEGPVFTVSTPKKLQMVLREWTVNVQFGMAHIRAVGTLDFQVPVENIHVIA